MSPSDWWDMCFSLWPLYYLMSVFGRSYKRHLGQQSPVRPTWHSGKKIVLEEWCLISGLPNSGVIFVISCPCWPAFVSPSPVESPFGDNFQYGPLGRNFFLRAVEKNGVVRN